MCGIVGILNFDNQKNVSPELLVSMRDCLVHRGPDGSDIYVDGNVGFGHRRLSIIDLTENGRQPFTSEDGRYTITFNGEIYNYKEFHQELRDKGVNLKTSSDTEVLLYMYITYGAAMLTRLNGMWAFAVWDSQEKTLFACRDRMGVKPFYYAIKDNALYFSSEPKALFDAGIKPEVEQAHLGEQLFYRYVAGENTLFRGVKKLLPGHYMKIDRSGKMEITRYWNLALQSQKYKISGDVYEWYEENFHRSIRYRMVSDAPVGVLLSGGLDSSAVLYSLYKQGYKDINTFTIRFSEAKYNEADLAKSLAERYGYHSHSMPLEGKLLFSDLSRAIWSHDEPLIHGNDPHLVAISTYSKDFVKVLLSGEGADELMGGYVRYKPIKRWNYIRMVSALAQFTPLKNRDRFKKLRRYVESSPTLNDALLLNASNIFPSDLRQIEQQPPTYRNQVLQEAREVFGNDPVKQMLYLDQHTYMVSLLDRNDRATMAAGIECREPFLDYNLVEGLASLPSNLFVKGKKGKHILYNSVGKHLPEEILNFKKLGFAVPWDRYLREDEQFRSVLESFNSSQLLNTGIFEQINKKQLLSAFLKGDNENKMLIFTLFMLRMWETEYLDKF